MKKVLFPFEIEKTCYREAYVYAVKLTRNLGAELIMLNAFNVEVDDTITTEKYDRLIKNNWIKASKEIILFHDYYLNHHAKVDNELRVKTDHRFIHGNLVEEFRKIIHSENIDLVVLPVTGENDSIRKKLRLMRKEALEKTLISLLATPCEKNFQPIDNILFTFGWKKLRGLKDYIEDISVFANMYNSSVHFIHLSRHTGDTQVFDEDVKNTISDASTVKNHIIYGSLNGRNLGNQLLNYISDNEIKLIALAKQQLHLFGDMFQTNPFEEMCSVVGIPVLILRDGD